MYHCYQQNCANTTMDASYESPPSIQVSKTFDLGSADSDDEPREPAPGDMPHFESSSYHTPNPTRYLGLSPPSNIFKHAPPTFFSESDMKGAPQIPNYLEDEMDLECCDHVTSGSIMILPRYSRWNLESPEDLTIETSLAMPSLYSGSDEESESSDDEENSSNCSTVASLSSMQQIRQERAARRAAVGKKALLQRATSDDPSKGLDLDNLSANHCGALAA